MRVVITCAMILFTLYSCKHKKNKENGKKPQLDIQIPIVLEEKCESFDLKFNGFYSSKALLPLYKTIKTDITKLELISKNVKRLNLSNSNLRILPAEITVFDKLEEIEISGNKFLNYEDVFSVLSNLPNLRILVLNNSNIKVIPHNIGKLKRLNALSLVGNNIRELPIEIGNLKELKYISLRNNKKLYDLPVSINKLECLEFLDVSGSGLSRLRDEMSQCVSLRSIIANASKIESLPIDFGNLVDLKSINLGHNRISVLPESIGNLDNLEHLSLGSNEIEYLPTSFGNLASLEILSLDFNRFKEYPLQINNLSKLQTLWLHNNNFPHIPNEVGDIKTLTHLLVDHELITDENIDSIKIRNNELYVIREDSRRYVGGIRRKQ